MSVCGRHVHSCVYGFVCEGAVGVKRKGGEIPQRATKTLRAIEEKHE